MRLLEAQLQKPQTYPAVNSMIEANTPYI